MTHSHRIAACLVVGLAFLPASVLGQTDVPVPAEIPKAKVEFKWLEGAPIKGVTQEKGIQTSCGPELSYLHKEAVLGNDDIKAARYTEYDLRKNGLSILYSVGFELKPGAGPRLAKECGEEEKRMLAVLIDGQYYGASWFVKSRDSDSFAASAGFFSSEAEAQRIVAAFK